MVSREFLPVTYGHQPKVVLVRRPEIRASLRTAGAERPLLQNVQPVDEQGAKFVFHTGRCGTRALKFVRSASLPRMIESLLTCSGTANAMARPPAYGLVWPEADCPVSGCTLKKADNEAVVTTVRLREVFGCS